MKIAIPVSEKKNEVADTFGRPPFFAMADIETGAVDYVDNSAIASAGGAGIKAAQLIVDNKCNAVIVPNCGQNAYDVLEAAGIKVYRMCGPSLDENITAFKDGKLELFEDVHPGFHGN